jgi:hypothetical protein
MERPILRTGELWGRSHSNASITSVADHFTPSGARGRSDNMKLASSSVLGFFAFSVLSACGGSGGSAAGPAEVNCPPGQTYDGEFCQVDQSVATAEQPAPAEPVAALVPVAEEKEPGPVDEPAAPTEVPPEEVPAAATAPSYASPVDVTMAAQAAPVVQYLASSHLPAGARPLGNPFAGQFAEGQIMEQKVQLTPDKCITVVAVGLPPVAEVNLEIFAEASKEPAAKDNTSGSQAVLGSKAQCFRPLASGTYRLVLSVAKGQGVAAAQVFQK